MKQIIFTLTSARSGTLFLKNVFQQNLRGCDCRHEPFFDRGNPTMLGPAIYDALAGRVDQLRALLAKKRAYVDRLKGQTYLESSHAFLKSAYLVALELFPQLELVHLIRDPLKVAKSEAYRETWRRRMHAPFHYYRGQDGRRHFFWSLTGNEEIFRAFNRTQLNLFQRYLIQWIEIENRAMTFLALHELHQRCFTLAAPRQLNDPQVLRSMFDFFRLVPMQAQLILRGRKNKSLGATTRITAEDQRQAATVLRQLPAQYLEIFHHLPYTGLPWRDSFLSLARGESSPEPAHASAASPSGIEGGYLHR